MAFWLTPVGPLAAFTLLVLGLGRFPRLGAALAVAGVAGSAAVSAFALPRVHDVPPSVSMTWLETGGRRLTLSLGLDPLGAVVAVLVSVVGLIGTVYAVPYMADEPRRGRFFAYWSLFIGAMLALVLAGDLITLFIAWELVGVCSYLLIGFWFERPRVAPAATKALVTTRIGDLAMLAGVLVLVADAGTSELAPIIGRAPRGGLALAVPAAVLVLAGAAAKSAQVPFQGWLPDAMVGPTPVSALLHSATMVAAGVFLIARLHPLFVTVPGALAAVAWIGMATALVGAFAALVEPDLKRTLAYSTMSQIGLMFVALGAGSVVAGVLLLVAQALYKALLFLAAGAVQHAVGGTEFARMGGLGRRMPAIAVAFTVGALALAGVPVTLALPAKDPALAAAWDANTALFVGALVAALLTAAYSARMVALVFLAPPSDRERQLHEPPRGLIAPVVALAVLVPLGLLADATLLGRPLSTFLAAGAPESAAVTAMGLLAAGAGLAIGLGAWSRWPRAIVWPPLERVAPGVTSELGLRWLYGATAQLAMTISAAVGAVDRVMFDPAAAGLARSVDRAVGFAGAVDRALFDRTATQLAHGARRAIRLAGAADASVFDAGATWLAKAALRAIHAVRGFDAARVESAALALARTALSAGRGARALQTGRIENYLLPAFVWALALFAAAALARGE